MLKMTVFTDKNQHSATEASVFTERKAIGQKKPSAKEQLTLFFVLAICAFSGYFSLFDGHNWGGDFALYISQTESILQGNMQEVMEENTFSMQQSTQMPGSNPQIGPNLYPWGFPLLLVPVYALFGHDIFAMKVYVLAFFLLSLLAIYFLFRKPIGHLHALLVVSLIGLNPNLIVLVDDVGSDIPYTFFAIVSLYFIQKLISSKHEDQNPWIFILTGLVIFVAFLVRTNGIILLGTLFLCQLIMHWQAIKERNFSGLHMGRLLIPYAIFFGMWLVIVLILPSGSGSHLAFLARNTPGKIAYNLMYYTRLPIDLFVSAPLPLLFFLLSIPFFLLGMYHRYRQDYHFLIYATATMAVFVLWPPLQGFRFILSVIPLFFYFTLFGMIRANKWLSNQRHHHTKPKPYLSVGFSLVLLVFFTINSFSLALSNMPKRKLMAGPYEESSRELFSFVDMQTEAGAVMVFFKPRVLNLFTERKSIRIRYFDEIMEGKGDYLIFSKDESFGQVNRTEVDNHSQYLQPVFENSDFMMYKIVGI
jgi:4-amino-4-deoxy-L-arabinose transferase-like glycosyltransferase